MAGFAADGLVASYCRQLTQTLAAAPLMNLPDGHQLTIADGPIPRLVNFTTEDQAAKGLRSLRDGGPERGPPVYLSALDVIQLHPALLLTAPHGAGKTVLANHLALHLAGEIVGAPDYGHAKLTQSAVRNEAGAAQIERWTYPAVVPFSVSVAPGMSLDAALTASHSNFRALFDEAETQNFEIVLIVDGVDSLGLAGRQFLQNLLDLQAGRKTMKIVAFATEVAAQEWALPPGFVAHALLPLLTTQRRAYGETHLAFLTSRTSRAAEAELARHPLFFVLSLWLDAIPSTPDALMDHWLAAALHPSEDQWTALADAADRSLRTQAPLSLPPSIQPRAQQSGLLRVLDQSPIRHHLAARHLLSLDVGEVVRRFAADPPQWAEVIESLVRQLIAQGRAPKALFDALLELDGDTAFRGALLVARNTHKGPLASSVATKLSALMTEGALSAKDREVAGRFLAPADDARDLEALVSIPGGAFTMGSHAHVNSAPPHTVTVGPFAIGVYPVVNRHYRRFVDDTHRVWASEDGRQPERGTAPAVDLSWHDANAYCAWLTTRWRREGRLSADEEVRLPTEPEWEFAARGEQPDAAIVYPWGSVWIPDAANSEEAGFNTTCTVGLFSRGRSPFGCLDMAGQVWEWTTTLWGDDMATPHFTYPYRADDGREARAAGPAIRRVLRGGCFSSNRLKVCCTYRGSLEPDGWWRGNGFRIVVAKHTTDEMSPAP